MAARITKSLGKKPDKIWHAAVLRAVMRTERGTSLKPEHRLERLADRLVEKGLEGDSAALREIGDRLDGKPAQALAIGGSEELGPLIVRWKGE